MKQIYLDHNATTPVAPEVAEVMLPYLTCKFGNASSVHSFGRDAKIALENARESIARMIKCDPSELFFTSGGTESDNIAIMGTAFQRQKKRNHIIVGATEHHAVLEPAEFLSSRHRFQLDLLAVNSEGIILSEMLKERLSDQTTIVSVMHANNETGVIQELEELTKLSKEAGALFHTDAVQSIGKIPVDVRQLGVDMLSLTGHKIYGPKGTGALYVRSGVKIAPLFYGGSHERKRRPGTENVAGAVGLAAALDLASERMESDFSKMKSLSSKLIDFILANIPDCHFNGSMENRVPQTVNISFEGIEGEAIVLNLDMEGVAVASGSACTSGAIEPSHVLTAMDVPAVTAQGAVRFSLGRSTTEEEIKHVCAILPSIIQRLREMSPVYNQSN